MYFNSNHINEKEEFELFINQEIKSKLDIKTENVIETFKKDIILKENLKKYTDIMDKFNVEYEILKDHNSYKKN